MCLKSHHAAAALVECEGKAWHHSYSDTDADYVEIHIVINRSHAMPCKSSL